MKYIHIYDTRTEYNAADKEDYDMSLIVEEDNYVVFYKYKTYQEQYFTIESLANNNTISIENVNCDILPSLKYSLNNGESWHDITITKSTAKNITTINSGEKILFKGQNNAIATAWDKYNRFNGSGNFKVYGNIMSLLYNNFDDKTSFPTNSKGNFSGLFRGTTTLIDASNLILPVLNCTIDCYNGMFRECTNLTIAPKLPATNGEYGSYSSMFEGCINLLEAPEINLINLGRECCKRMFCMNRNNKITTPKMIKSPILRASEGIERCYDEMFKGNGNLTEVTCLMTSGFQCDNWLTNCSSTGLFIKSPDANWTTGNSGIPSGWTIQNYEGE